MTNEQVRRSIEDAGIGTRNQQVDEIERKLQQTGGQGGAQAQSEDTGPHGEVIAGGGMGTATGDPEAGSLEELREEVGSETGRTARHEG